MVRCVALNYVDYIELKSIYVWPCSVASGIPAPATLLLANFLTESKLDLLSLTLADGATTGSF